MFSFASRFLRWAPVLGLIALTSTGLGSIAPPVFEPIYAFPLPPYQAPLSVQASLVHGIDGNLYGTSEIGGEFSRGTVFRMTPAGELTVLHSFSDEDEGSSPNGLMQASDGNFYGTTFSGTSESTGTIYKITPKGGYTTLKSLVQADGVRPDSALVEGRDGMLYGIASGGGMVNGTGTFFRISKAGDFKVLISFSQLDAWKPTSGLILGSDGNFYGTSNQFSISSVVRLTPDGTIAAVATIPSGWAVRGRLMQTGDGNFYGTTANGGTNNYGSFFRMTPDGTVTVLSSFGPATGSQPNGDLIQGPDGNFYGTTRSGGFFSGGLIYQLTPAGQITRQVNLTAANPYAGLVLGDGGIMYGATTGNDADQKGLLFKTDVQAHYLPLVVLGNPSAGYVPTGVTQAADGTLHGGTLSGGQRDAGTTFQIDPAGTYTQPTDFYGGNGSNPQIPYVQGADGNYYTVTNNLGASGNGSIIRVLPDGEASILASFDDSNGNNPATLIAAGDGNLYGTTRYGGPAHYGNIFKVTLSGTLTSVLNFDPTAATPVLPARLIQAKDGNLYAIGLGTGTGKTGVIYKKSATGDFTVLTRFTAAGVSGPPAALVQGTDGSYYGVSSTGGSSNGGLAFKLTTAGVYTLKASFDANLHPAPTSLVQASDGNFYGTTWGVDPSGILGSVFKMTSSGALSTLLDFNGSNGSFPNSLTVGMDGNLYGTTQLAGTRADGLPGGGGQVFRLRFGPSATTAAATLVKHTTATLHGSVDPRGKSTTVSLQYGTSPALATFTTVPLGTLTGTAPITVDAPLTGLAVNTVYYFRVVASNADNALPQSGAILSFTTFSPFSQWLTQQELTGGATGDDDHDGLSNMLEYALGTDPHLAATNPAVEQGGILVSRGTPSLRPDGSGNVALFTRRKDRADSGLTYTPQFSTDLVSWTDSTAAPVVLGSDSEMEILSVPVPPGAMQFFRLTVAVPSE